MPRLVDHERAKMIMLCEYDVCQNAVSKRNETVLIPAEKNARGRVDNLSFHQPARQPGQQKSARAVSPRPNDPPTEDGESNYSMLRLPLCRTCTSVGWDVRRRLEKYVSGKNPSLVWHFRSTTHIAHRLASSPLRRQNCASRPWTTPHTIKTTCCCPGPG